MTSADRQALSLTLETVAAATGGRVMSSGQGAAFGGVAIDSRTIAPGQLFVAICGERHDGHAFIDHVIAHGVRGLVVQEDHIGALNIDKLAGQGVACVAVADTVRSLGALARWWRDQFDIPLVAVTGSNGKTTTRRMAALVMEQGYDTLATHGNFNNEIGVPLTLFRLESRHQAAVLELGLNHFGEMDRLGGICKPTIGVITNVAASHLAYLGSVEGVARAKGELIHHIDPAGALVLNKDDPHVAALADRAACRVLFFGMTEGAAVQARALRGTPDGMAFDLLLPAEEKIVVRLKTHGRFMVANALAAAAAGHLAGLDGTRIKRGLEAFEPVKGRLSLTRTAAGVNLIDDTYNANPGSVAAAFEALSSLKQDAPTFIVLGDMLELGQQAESLHRRIGRQAAALAPRRLYVCGACAEYVARAATEAGMPPNAVRVGTKEQIAADLAERMGPGCWVLVKGSRGMAMETIAETVRRWRKRPADNGTGR